MVSVTLEMAATETWRSATERLSVKLATPARRDVAARQAER